MHRTVLSGLRIFSPVFVTTGYLALATTPSYPVTIVLVPFLLFLLAPMGERLDRHFPAYRRVTYWASIVVLLLAIGSIFFIQLLGGVTVLVMYIQAYTIMHEKRIRSYYHLYLMSFFLLLAASVMSPEPEIGMVMALFIISGVISLVLLHLYGEFERNPERLPPMILPLDVREVPVAPNPQKRVDLGLFATIGMIVIASLAGTAFMFYATPRMQAGILGRTDPMLFRSAFTPTVELSGGGRIAQDQTAVMHVEFPEEPEGRFEGGMFWRISALSDYDNSRWSHRPLPGASTEPALAFYVRSPLYVPKTTPTEATRNANGSGRLVHQSIYMDNVPQEGVPALTLVKTMKCGQGTRNADLSWDESGDFSIALARTGQRWLQYDAWSEIEQYSAERLRSAPDNYAEAITSFAYNILTHHDLEPRTVELSKSIVEGKDTVYDKVLAIGAYFNSGGYAYTLDLPILPPKHAVDTFIHDTKVGHCEIFSSAMALMLRALGIPTRVVAGYRGGEWSPGDRSYIVRADMAHLWVEVYFLGLGWVTFDPSPSDDIRSGLSQTWIARTITRYTLKAKMAWYRNVIAYDRGVQLDSLRDVSLGFFTFGGDLFGRISEISAYRNAAAAILLGVVIVALASGGAALLFLRGRGHGYATLALTSDQARAVRLHRRLYRRLEILGKAPQGKTAEELSRELDGLAEGQAAPVLEALNVYNEVRFGGRPLPWTLYNRLLSAIKGFHIQKQAEK